jgi:hypothetical protein
MTKGDALMERGAGKLQRLADRAAASGGLAGKLAQPLADDAQLFRRMKPSLIVARAKGNRGGPNPFVVLGAAFALGIAAAKVIDWRGHAHPRD